MRLQRLHSPDTLCIVMMLPAVSCCVCVCREIVDYVNSLAPGPLGGSDADQRLAKAWVDKLVKWDGNLFIAANGDPGGVTGLLVPRCSSCKHLTHC